MDEKELRRYAIAIICAIKTQLQPDEEINIAEVAMDFDKALSEYDLYMS